jgi:hypothetical protein
MTAHIGRRLALNGYDVLVRTNGETPWCCGGACPDDELVRFGWFPRSLHSRRRRPRRSRLALERGRRDLKGGESATWPGTCLAGLLASIMNPSVVTCVWVRSELVSAQECVALSGATRVAQRSTARAPLVNNGAALTRHPRLHRTVGEPRGPWRCAVIDQLLLPRKSRAFRV